MCIRHEIPFGNGTRCHLSWNCNPREKKYGRGQIVLTVPPSGTESAHLARATQGLDGPFLLTPLWALLSIWQDVTLEETHQDSSLGSAYKVTPAGTNQVEHLECKHAACRRGCSALVFPSPFTVPEIFTRAQPPQRGTQHAHLL